MRWVLLLVLAGGCVEREPPPPSCNGSRSRCVAGVALGARFGCALLRDRTVWCWGRNDESQLGYPTTDLCPEELPGGQTRSIACHAFPFQVTGLDRVVRVAAGGAFACAQREDGSLRCWGSNSVGQLGNGLTLPSPRPVVVRGLTGVTSLATGARHACAVAGGRVHCWGANDRGQLGQASASRVCMTPDGNVPCEPEPVAIEGLVDVTAVVAGAAHTCVRTTEGLALCWGDNRYGQLGVGTASAMPSPMPQAVLAGDLPLEAIRTLTAGAEHSCAHTEAGDVWCWGRNDHGELGVAPSRTVPEHCAGPCNPRPDIVPGLPRRVVESDAGADATADVIVDATMEGAPDVARGDDASEAGDASESDSGARVRDAVAPPSMIPRAVAAGGTFACAALEDGTVRCWGDDADGQLGDGRRVRDPHGPVLVIATPGAARNNPLQAVGAVAAGSATACALLTDGSLRCWGSNQAGALGNGTTSTHAGPVPVTW